MKYFMQRVNSCVKSVMIEILRWGKPDPDDDLFKHDGPCFYRYDSEWGDVVIDDVTHWMPLPKDPEVKK